MEIINKTPHPVLIVDQDGLEQDRFESQGQVRLATRIEAGEPIDGIPTTKTVFGEAEGLPAPQSGTYYIVSQMIRSALPSREDLLVPAEVVRDSSGAIIGCRSLGR